MRGKRGWEWLSTMSAVRVGWRGNALKQSQKQNLDQEINDSKPHIWGLFFKFRFSSRKSQSQQKLAKKITRFTIQFCSKTLAYFTSLNPLNTVRSILPEHSQKPYSLYKFSRHVSGWYQKKNICTALFLDAQELHSQST